MFVFVELETSHQPLNPEMNPNKLTNHKLTAFKCAVAMGVDYFTVLSNFMPSRLRLYSFNDRTEDSLSCDVFLFRTEGQSINTLRGSQKDALAHAFFVFLVVFFTAFVVVFFFATAGVFLAADFDFLTLDFAFFLVALVLLVFSFLLIKSCLPISTM